MKRLLVSVAAFGLVAGTAGLSLIKQSEGLRQVAYVDPVGIPTVCWGHTGPEVKVGERWSLERCEAVFKEDIAEVDADIQSCVAYPVNVNQHGALRSFFFNFGRKKSCGSTLVKHLNAGDMAGVQREWPKWKNGSVNGVMTVLKGLVKRRTAEWKLFTTPVTSTSEPDMKSLVSQTGE